MVSAHATARPACPAGSVRGTVSYNAAVNHERAVCLACTPPIAFGPGMKHGDDPPAVTVVPAIASPVGETTR